MNKECEALPASLGRRLQVRVFVTYAFAFIIPILVAFAAFAILGLYPFGNDTVSCWDLQITYTYFYQWFQQVLSGNGSVFYSFSKSLGGNMYGTFVGFMLSPVSWLSYFFAGSNIMDFVTFSIVFKFGLAGLGAFFYLRRRFILPPVVSLALSTCYAMSLFMTTQSANPMWMDVVAVFPIVLLGVYRVVHLGRPTVLFAGVFVCIILDWYNGYMVCLFTIIFFLFESFLEAPHARGVGKRVWFKCMVNPGRFSIAFALAVASSMFVLLPLVITLLGGKGGYQGGLFNISFRYDFVDVFRSFFLGVYEKEYLPQFYTGTLVLISSIWYFINPAIEKRERIAAFVLLAFMVFSSWFAPMDRVWCGLRDSNSFYCRFSFLVSGVLLFTAARALMTLSKKSVPSLVVSSAAVFIVAGIIFCSKDYPSPSYLVVTWAVCLLIPALLILSLYVKGKGWRNTFLIMLLLVVAAEAFVSCRQVFQYRMQSSSQVTYSDYASYFGDGWNQYNELDANDDDSADAYRVCKLYSLVGTSSSKVTSNESLVYGYSQVAGYDSAYDDRVQNFLSAIGYSGNWDCITTYNYPVLPADSLLGIRYVSSDECPAGLTESSNLTQTQNGNLFYENVDALPLGFGANSAIVDDSINQNGNPFDYQEAFYSRLLGAECDLYSPASCSQVERTDEQITWEVEVPAGGLVYGYVSGDPWLSLDLYIDGESQGSYLDQWSQGIFAIQGEDDVSSAHTVTLRVKDSAGWNEAATTLSDSLDFDASFNILNQDVYSDAVSTLASQPFEIDVFDDGHVHGTYSAQEDGLLFTTIPYDSGWTVKVNGQVVEPEIAQDTFLAIPISAGDNDIEMSYLPPGLIIGTGVSLVSIALYIFFALLFARRDKRHASDSGGGNATMETNDFESEEIS